MATREQMAVAEARARCRGDGGALFVVSGTNREGRRVALEAVAEIDARHFAFDLRMNGWTDVATERVR